MSEVIRLESAGVAYRVMHDRSASIKQAAIDVMRGRRGHLTTVEALRDVSLSVDRGDVLGIIGANGAGKSTLLKLIARVIPPTRGRVLVRGRVGGLIELGAGLNGELTGAQNIVMYGALLGRDPRAMRTRVSAISEWAGITDAIDLPVRSYSSGMLARLAFSIITDEATDILLIDEVLAVGDEDVRRRSADRIYSLIDRGTAVLLVSHDLDAVTRMCSRALWIDAGRVRAHGAVAAVVPAYRQSAGSPEPEYAHA